MHSSFNDMHTWMNFLMDTPGSEAAPAHCFACLPELSLSLILPGCSQEERERFASVLDPATRAEMRNLAHVMGDGLSAQGAGTFEVWLDGRYI